MDDIVILSLDELEFENAKIVKPCKDLKEINCDIILIMPNVRINSYKINAKIIILYGDLGYLSLKNVKCDSIVTYGMANRNTITISSVDNMLIAVQREITKLDKNKTQIGEFFSKRTQKNEIFDLAIESLRLIIG